MNKKTIYIHIGTPKTGTTSIQNFLTKNFEALLEEGVFYPLIGRYYLNDSHIPESGTIKSEDYKNLRVCMNGAVLYEEYELKNVLEEFSKSKKNKMVLSEERLFTQDENSSFSNNEKIWNLLLSYDVKVIVYFRRSVEYLCSLWQEYMKYRVQTDLLNFLENGDYLKNLNNFHNLAERVGKQNIIVKTFEKETWVNNNLIEDFLSILGVEKSGKFQEFESFENSGLPRDRCDRLLYVNKHLQMKTSDPVLDNINERIPEGINNQKVIDSLPDELIEKITDKYYPEECKIAKTFLNREELFQSKYPKIYKTERPQYTEYISEEDKEELRSIVYSTLQKQSIDNQKQIIELQKQIINNQNRFIFLSKIKNVLKKLWQLMRSLIKREV